MDLMDYLNRAHVSLFRWESLQDYSATDKKIFNSFKETGEIDTEYMSAWLNFLSRKKSLGTILQRVRLITEPQTEYTKFEINIFKSSQKYGDEIRTITEDNYKKSGVTGADFWLIDNSIVLRMNYGEMGMFEGFEVIETNIQEYIDFKESLLKYSTSL